MSKITIIIDGDSVNNTLATKIIANAFIELGINNVHAPRLGESLRVDSEYHVGAVIKNWIESDTEIVIL